MLMLGFSEVDRHTVTRTTAQLAICCTTLSLIFATTLSLYFGSMRGVNQARGVILVRYFFHVTWPLPNKFVIRKQEGRLRSHFSTSGFFCRCQHYMQYGERSFYAHTNSEAYNKSRGIVFSIVSALSLIWQHYVSNPQHRVLPPDAVIPRILVTVVLTLGITNLVMMVKALIGYTRPSHLPSDHRDDISTAIPHKNA